MSAALASIFRMDSISTSYWGFYLIQTTLRAFGNSSKSHSSPIIYVCGYQNVYDAAGDPSAPGQDGNPSPAELRI